MQTAHPLTSGLTNEDKAELWAAAHKLRGHLDAAEDKHVVLGLNFLSTLTRTLHLQFAESTRLEAAIRDNLGRLGIRDTTETGL